MQINLPYIINLWQQLNIYKLDDKTLENSKSWD